MLSKWLLTAGERGPDQPRGRAEQALAGGEAGPTPGLLLQEDQERSLPALHLLERLDNGALSGQRATAAFNNGSIQVGPMAPHPLPNRNVKKCV